MRRRWSWTFGRPAGSEELVALVPQKWIGKIVVAVLVAAAEVVLKEATKKKR